MNKQEVNIQEECIKIHHQFATSEMANYKIQLLFDSEIEKVKKEYEEKLRWIPIEEKLPQEDGQDILMKNENWIDEDYNLLGVRIGVYGDGIWTSAYWCRVHDEYHTRISDEDDNTFEDSKAESQIPTHWRPIL